MRIPKRRPPFMLAFEYEQYMKLTALHVQYVRAMERRQADRDEIRAPKHRLAADTMANLRAVDRDPSVTWSEYEDWLTKLPPGRIR